MFDRLFLSHNLELLLPLTMISKALLHLLSASYASAYFAEANNAHLEFVATGTTSETAAASSDTTVFTVDSNSLKHHPSHLKALEDALAAQPPSLGFSAPHILDLFEGWMKKFKKEYETAEEKMERLLIFLQNHGEYIMCHVMCFYYTLFVSNLYPFHKALFCINLLIITYYL